uniref:FIP-RBD domain-containing protein n=1 Tax=Salarias fasciatus TaxID=181472 RepID=A0A672FBG4_SALFA
PPLLARLRPSPLTEGAGSYYHLTHSELVSLLVQRERDLDLQRPQVRDLEDYIDTLLVRIMEQKPTLLQVRSKFK